MSLARLYHTVKHLRWQQLWFRVYYSFLKRFYTAPKAGKARLDAASSFPAIVFFHIAPYDQVDAETNCVSLLNIEQQYPETIDWNDGRHGMLWAYHLNYFNWLEDTTVAVSSRLQSIRQFAVFENHTVGLDSYPISLRGINWIRFFSENKIGDEQLNSLLYQHYHRLFSFPEYAIQSNHLWENGCSLLWAGHYFNDEAFYILGKKILQKALQEQVLADGMHIEGSPMYHSLLLQRLLQTIEMLRCSNRFEDQKLLAFLEEKASLMLGWLQQITFSDGSWPQLNDSTSGIAPTTMQLMEFAKQLAIHSIQKKLESSYRKIQRTNWELVLDVGNIQPSWQPGHSHADAFTFCLHVNGQPIIVDPGIATYAVGERRNWERSTAAHNAVAVGNKNSSDTWKSFRVGRRAQVKILSETAGEIAAEHDGYRLQGILTQRKFAWQAHKIIITDTLKDLKGTNASLNLHFHPDVQLEVSGEKCFKAGCLTIDCSEAESVEVTTYFYAKGFNKTRIAKRLNIVLGETMKTVFDIQEITC